MNALKQLAATSVETNRGDITEKILSDKSHCEVRDWLITRILIDNNGRSGVVANMTTSEFKEAVVVNEKRQLPAEILGFNHQISVLYKTWWPTVTTSIAGSHKKG